jgi:hypothetical protein
METHNMACKSWKVRCVVLQQAYYRWDVHHQFDDLREKSMEQTEKQENNAKSLIEKEERDV